MIEYRFRLVRRIIRRERSGSTPDQLQVFKIPEAAEDVDEGPVVGTIICRQLGVTHGHTKCTERRRHERKCIDASLYVGGSQIRPGREPQILDWALCRRQCSKNVTRSVDLIRSIEGGWAEPGTPKMTPLLELAFDESTQCRGEPSMQIIRCIDQDNLDFLKRFKSAKNRCQ